MRRIHLICSVTIILISAFINADALEISLTPGALHAQREILIGNHDSKIKLTGHADVRDICLLKYVSDDTKVIDLSSLTIDAYTYPQGAAYLGRQNYATGELPGYILAGTEVTNIILPQSLIKIAEGAFAASALTSLTIPESVTEIGDYLCSDSPFLKEVVIPAIALTNSVGCFRNCNLLESIHLRDKATSIAESALEGCRSLKVNPVPDAQSYGASALRATGITHLDISAANQVGDYAFAQMNDLKSITIKADGATIFGIGTFYGDSALENLPEWKSNIPPLLGACTAVGLTNRIDTPTISTGAFANNEAPTKIILGPNVREIARDAFRNNSSIMQVDVSELGKHIPQMDHHAFAGLENAQDKYDITLYVAQYYQALWEENPEWSRFNIIGLDTSVGNVIDTFSVRAIRDANDLIITSNNPIDYLEVFTISGINLYNNIPGSIEISLPVPGEMLIVRIKSGNRLKIIKVP